MDEKTKALYNSRIKLMNDAIAMFSSIDVYGKNKGGKNANKKAEFFRNA